jgi:DNA invertase Pin-like site-specific DNA recombinase
MKGTMSEMEVSVFRQRSIEAMKQKARRGELFLTVAVGYTKTGDDRVEMNPDRRVREAIAQGHVERRSAHIDQER